MPENSVRQPTRALCAALAVAACAAIAACSSPVSSSSSAPVSSAPASSAASASVSSAALAGATATEKVIAANWTAFFNPNLAVTTREGLLEDGREFATPIKAQASSSTARESSAEVTSVRMLSAAQARVTYDILLNGTPVMTKQSGTAVLQDGTWKVSESVYCGLLTLDTYQPMPAVCS